MKRLCFLNMRCGDRLGHALALGVDVKEWYTSKSNYILISQMDYLDNIVWLYSKIREYSINGYEDILQYIERKYDEYFRVIYKNYMCEDDERKIIKKQENIISKIILEMYIRQVT